MSKSWYDMIALRNGGYRSNAKYSIEGRSGEMVFEERLMKRLPMSNMVLDAGCGDGGFTLKMSQYTKRIIGFDNSQELLKIANSLIEEVVNPNVEFVYGWTHENLPFLDEYFDLIYVRRGPPSIINHPHLLKSGGRITGIHTEKMEQVEELLKKNGFIRIQFEVFDDAKMIFPNEMEFMKYLSSIPGNPDYSLTKYKLELEEKIKEHMVCGQIVVSEWRYIWSAVKP